MLSENLHVGKVSGSEVAPATQQLLDRDIILEYLKEVEELSKRGVKHAAFILLWVCVEALLRHIASQEGLPLERVPSSALLKELFSLGLLSRNGLAIALRAFSVRNALVHGFQSSGPEVEESFGALTLLVQELLADYDQVRNRNT
jgi:hypothetical protein